LWVNIQITLWVVMDVAENSRLSYQSALAIYASIVVMVLVELIFPSKSSNAVTSEKITILKSDFAKESNLNEWVGVREEYVTTRWLNNDRSFENSLKKHYSRVWDYLSRFNIRAKNYAVDQLQNKPLMANRSYRIWRNPILSVVK